MIKLENAEIYDNLKGCIDGKRFQAYIKHGYGFGFN